MRTDSNHEGPHFKPGWWHSLHTNIPDLPSQRGELSPPEPIIKPSLMEWAEMVRLMNKRSRELHIKNNNNNNYNTITLCGE